MDKINIIDELGQNFIDYSYEFNSCRAFADVRDGLKPGQRACLWEMYIKGYTNSKPFVKSAKIAGGITGTWWPHGDAAIYDTFTRMSQNWINNIPEVDWHGNNGSVTIGADTAAAPRYTEARLAKIIEDGMFQGIKKNNVNMILNYTEDEEWPEVLPAIFPRLLVNGCQGIGSTIANVWLPHSFDDIVDSLIKYIETGNIDVNNLYPSFPCGCTIINKNDIHNIYETGRGKVILRAEAEIKDNHIYFHEIPYQVYVEPLIDKIKDMIVKDEIKGIEHIYNRSSKNGLLIDVECSDIPNKVLDNLYAKTDLQRVYNANQWGLVGKTPKLLNLKEYYDIYLEHNIQCIIREFSTDISISKKRVHIIDGLLIALEDIDNVINLIKKSSNSLDAKQNLITTYKIDEEQAKSILAMRLSSLAKLEKLELLEEKNGLLEKITEWESIINSEQLQKETVKTRLIHLNQKYQNPRKTAVCHIDISKTPEEKEAVEIEPEKCVVVLTESNYIKRIPISSFKTQRRAGKGVKTQDDITSMILRTNTVDSLMIFTNQGRMYRLLVNDIPEGTNSSKGTLINNLIQMEYKEKAEVIYSIYKDTDAQYVLFTTKQGLVKKTALDEYIKTKKKNGIAAISLKDNDTLSNVCLIKEEPIIIVTKKGHVIKFNSSEISLSSRVTMGVKGINLNPGDEVVATVPVRDINDTLAIFAADGHGKRVAKYDITPQKRGGKGACIYKVSDSAGELVAAALISDEDKILITGDKTSICLTANEIPILQKASIGNNLIKGNIKAVSKI